MASTMADLNVIKNLCDELLRKRRVPGTKRRVTFDPELLRPSSGATPPILPLEHLPAIVSLADIKDIVDAQTYKSILKNPPTSDNRAYDSLCNFLIDLPPPPSSDLLSLDILQQETVFKPKNRFAQLTEPESSFPIHTFESSSSESSDDESLPDIKAIDEIHNIADIINEDDVLFRETALKPKTFEASLLLENTADERIEFTLSTEDDLKRSLDSTELKEEAPWLAETQGKLSKEPNLDVVFNDLIENSANLPRLEVVEEPVICERQELYLSEPNEEIDYAPNVDQEVKAFVDSNDTLDRRREIDEITTSRIPLVEAESRVEQVSQNIRKLDDEFDELLADFEIANKRNKPNIDETEPKEESTELISQTTLIKDFQKDASLILNEEGLHRDRDSESSNLLEEPVGGKPDSQNVHHWDESAEINIVVRTSVESIRPTPRDSVTPRDGSVNPDTIKLASDSGSIITPVPEIQENTSRLTHNQVNNNTPVSSASTEPINSVPTNTTSAEASEVNSTRHRRKSGRKGHRKHSLAGRSGQSAAAQTAANDTNNTCNTAPLPSTNPDQRTLDAQAKFKRYLGKMSAKAMSENQNLNCAGEPETLEPHQRDSIKESQVLIWIYNMIDEAARVDFEFFLKDGCILCKLMNRIVPGGIPENEITWEGARSKQKNISNFLREAEKYGVPKAKLFFAEDLLHLRHIPRVTRCIYALAKIAQSDATLGPDMPQLGDEPSFLKEASTKVVIPGHRDTKEVLAQLTASKEEDNKAKKTKHSLYK